MIRFIGDVHGKYGQYKRLIEDVPVSIQAGDMGVGFIGIRHGERRALANPPHDAMSKGSHYYIRGNHDNPSVCRSQPYWIPDGTMHEGVFCLGGAVSIDRVWRTEGWDWWPDEELSYSELQECLDRYTELRPEVVCTHDCPAAIADRIIGHHRMQKIEDGSRTRSALEQMFRAHQPRLWIFGHWHVPITLQWGPTTFQCLNELGYVDVEI